MRAPAWRWGLASRRPQPFNASRTPRSRPGESWPAHSCTLGDGGRGQAQGGDAGASIGSGSQIAGDGEGFRRQGCEAHLVAPVVEQTPLGAVDAPGVVGEDRLQGVGHALVSGTQSRHSGGLAEDDLRVGSGGGNRRVSGGGISGAISAGKSCAITIIIARRTDVGKRSFGARFAAFSSGLTSSAVRVSHTVHVKTR